MRHILFIYFMFSVISAFSQNTQISPGVLWNDINGEQINAHGGCVVFENGFYYWFGEDRTGFVSNGVSCYQSKDLYNWSEIIVKQLFKNTEIIFHQFIDTSIAGSHLFTGHP